MVIPRRCRPPPCPRLCPPPRPRPSPPGPRLRNIDLDGGIQAQALDPATHLQPATAEYTKLKQVKHYRDKYLYFGGKTVAGFKYEENAKPSSHVTEPKAHLVKGWDVRNAQSTN